MDIKSTILENSLELFLQRGCKAVTMDDVAKENGISKRTLYELFTDKSDLLEQCIGYLHCHMMQYSAKMEEDSQNLLELLFKIHETQSDVIINLKRNFFMELKRYYYPIYKKTVEKFTVYHREKTIEYLKQGQKEGLVIENINIDLVTKIIIEISNIIEDSEVFPLKEHSRKDLFREVVILYFRGISTLKGIEMIDKYIQINK
ncbi:MAG: TetR/AcrR family transcriptional regulator [Bacteroidales bacterium]|jgi:TetR/AcrR family transcriptional regulator, cholesterol catabolism regulator|nr:TetR/AcrR family transcriptional regulator [Bacteroidales bacterium]